MVKHPFRILTQFRRGFSLRDLPSCALIIKKHQFMPSVIDRAFHEWANRGIATIENLSIDNTFASFDQLKLKFNILNSNFFRFLQLRSFTSKSFTHFPSQPSNSPWNHILNLNSGSKGIIVFITKHIKFGAFDIVKDSMGGRLGVLTSWEYLGKRFGQNTFLFNLFTTHSYPVQGSAWPSLV